jgi:hypothetical protein
MSSMTQKESKMEVDIELTKKKNPGYRKMDFPKLRLP